MDLTGWKHLTLDGLNENQKQKLHKILSQLVNQLKNKEQFFSRGYYFPSAACVYNGQVYCLGFDEYFDTLSPDVDELLISPGPEYSGEIPEFAEHSQELAYTPGKSTREHFAYCTDYPATGDLKYVIENWKIMDWVITPGVGEAEFMKEKFFRIAETLRDLFGDDFVNNCYDEERERSRESKNREEE